MDILSVLRQRPQAVALVNGSREHPRIQGRVLFYQTPRGTLVRAEISGLPTQDNLCKSPIFAFHIHTGERCSGNDKDPFADALGHFDPYHCLHPYHAGDMPPLFGNDGYALSVFLTDRFMVRDVIGRTVIIHAEPDDFTTQPSSNSGEKIACGEIRRLQR